MHVHFMCVVCCWYVKMVSMHVDMCEFVCMREREEFDNNGRRDLIAEVGLDFGLVMCLDFLEVM